MQVRPGSRVASIADVPDDVTGVYLATLTVSREVHKSMRKAPDKLDGVSALRSVSLRRYAALRRKYGRSSGAYIVNAEVLFRVPRRFAKRIAPAKAVNVLEWC